MKTTLPKVNEIERKWYVVDAEGQTLGRLAVQIADVLRGRNKPIYTPHIDTGDYVIVVNAEKVKLSGNKEKGKRYMFFSGWRGNEKYRTVAEMREQRPEFIMQHAVKCMLPKNKLASAQMKKLKVIIGAEHGHEAQNPVPFAEAPGITVTHSTRA